MKNLTKKVLLYSLSLLLSSFYIHAIVAAQEKRLIKKEFTEEELTEAEEELIQTIEAIKTDPMPLEIQEMPKTTTANKSVLEIPKLERAVLENTRIETIPFLTLINNAIKFIDSKAKKFPSSDMLKEAAAHLRERLGKLQQDVMGNKVLKDQSIKNYADRAQLTKLEADNRIKIKKESFKLSGNAAAQHVFLALIPLIDEISRLIVKKTMIKNTPISEANMPPPPGRGSQSPAGKGPPPPQPQK